MHTSSTRFLPALKVASCSLLQVTSPSLSPDCTKNSVMTEHHQAVQNNANVFTLQAVSMSDTAFRLRLAVAITSSCLHEFPAATALAVAMVIPFVILIDSSGDEVFSGISLDWNTWKLEIQQVKKKKKTQKREGPKIIYSSPTGLPLTV